MIFFHYGRRAFCSLTPEQKFTNQLIENVDSYQKSVIWNRENYENILNKFKIKGHSLDYYHMQN